MRQNIFCKTKKKNHETRKGELFRAGGEKPEGVRRHHTHLKKNFFIMNSIKELSNFPKIK